MGPTWEVVMTGSSKCGTGSKDLPDVSRGEDQIEAEALLESPVVELWDETASKSGNSSTVEPSKEAIEAPLFSGMWSGTLLIPFSCTTGCIIMEAAALLARNNCRLSSGVARTIKKIDMCKKCKTFR